MESQKNISPAVIKRLPRYYRYLGELLNHNIQKISSRELSLRMNVTASQIRQDLNCFGGFGQQGYGYNVEYLYHCIRRILGLDKSLCAILVGIGHLGQALANNSLFEKCGVRLIGLFDIADNLVGTAVGGETVRHFDTVGDFCAENRVDIAVLTVPRTETQAVAERLVRCGVFGFWNFANTELSLPDDPVKIENVHMRDSLMQLCYRLTNEGEILT